MALKREFVAAALKSYQVRDEKMKTITRAAGALCSAHRDRKAVDRVGGRYRCAECMALLEPRKRK